MSEGGNTDGGVDLVGVPGVFVARVVAVAVAVVLVPGCGVGVDRTGPQMTQIPVMPTRQTITAAKATVLERLWRPGGALDCCGEGGGGVVVGVGMGVSVGAGGKVPDTGGAVRACFICPAEA